MFFFVDMIKYLKVIKSGIVQIFYQKVTEGLVQQGIASGGGPRDGGAKLELSHLCGTSCASIQTCLPAGRFSAG